MVPRILIWFVSFWRMLIQLHTLFSAELWNDTYFTERKVGIVLALYSGFSGLISSGSESGFPHWDSLSFHSFPPYKTKDNDSNPEMNTSFPISSSSLCVDVDSAFGSLYHVHIGSVCDVYLSLMLLSAPKMEATFAPETSATLSISILCSDPWAELLLTINNRVSDSYHSTLLTASLNNQ